MKRHDEYRAPEYIRSIKPYPTGRPPELLMRELAVDRLTMLASNENPWGPSPKAVAALGGATAELHRYPDGGSFLLKEALAARHGLAPENVVVGSGSGELVDLLCKAFVEDGQKVVMSRYGFIQYRLSAWAVNGQVADAEVDADLRDDIESFAARAQGARLVFLANPNNPTGTHITRAELDRYFSLVGDDVLTVVDQAYREYADAEDYPDALDDLKAGRNVVVLGTFSKVYGLAGLRVGYGFGPAGVLIQLEGARMPFNVNSMAQVAALAALEDQEYVETSRRRNREEMERLVPELRRRGFAVEPTLGNFVLARGADDAKSLTEKLFRRGVLVRPMGGYGLPKALRITVGGAQERDALLAALDAELGGDR